jgi:hypothetical protein
MRKIVIPAVFVLVLASGAAPLAAAGGSGKARAASKPRARTFTMYTATTQFKLIDQGDPGFSLGDQDVFTDNVFTRKNGARLGIDGGVCTVVLVASAATLSGTLQCLVTYSLKGGQITAQGLARGWTTRCTAGRTARRSPEVQAASRTRAVRPRSRSSIRPIRPRRSGSRSFRSQRTSSYA